MRDIKFKAKSPKIDGKWHYGSFIDNNQCDFDSYIQEDGGDRVLIERDTISQYTNLKDKNGVEIYENDIVKFDSIETFIVKYDYTSFKLEQIDKQYCDEMSMFYHRIPTMFEVIGNIFDKEV